MKGQVINLTLIFLEKKYETKYDIIVILVQGDEPMTHPNMINEAVEPMLKDSSLKWLIYMLI